ncbi:hypothetical protein H920_01492 [Fukomys damarensis]|uniref:Uncharacterized protein n=1 Tax=Fukomys damarensis TaxID=885580 RepID=A0A091EN92_FUKDA|nr:hypothetical protein H920_01492 [Fukomys damarensis]
MPPVLIHKTTSCEGKPLGFHKNLDKPSCRKCQEEVQSCPPTSGKLLWQPFFIVSGRKQEEVDKPSGPKVLPLPEVMRHRKKTLRLLRDGNALCDDREGMSISDGITL